MKETKGDNFKSTFDDDIDLQEILYILIQGKWIIILVTTFICLIGLIYSLLMPNIYESKAILVPADSSSNISGAIQNYGSLASLAGINLPNQSIESNSEQAFEKLSSLSFFENNIMPNIFLPDLMAIKSWDYERNVITYDESIYDIESNNWVREYSYPRKQTPSAQESFELFQENTISISEDIKTGFITLAVKHQSPFIAKEWVDLIINEINAFYRQKDKIESQIAADYLNSQMAMTDLSEIKQVIAELLKQETQKLTLIEAKQFYVYDFIDPPAVMELKSEPRRFMIFIIFTFLGFMLGIFITIVKYFVYSKTDSSI